MWGFSRSLIFVGLLLEAVWCLACMYLFALAAHQSDLNDRGRSITGGIRTILDLADSLNRDLGGDTNWHSERELKNALKGHKPVGYATWEANGKARMELGLVPFDARAPRRRRLTVQRPEELKGDRV